MNVVEPIRDVEIIHAIEDRLATLDTAKGMRQYLLFECGIYLGLRISDLTKLTVGMVRGREYFTLKEKKTGKVNQVPIADKLRRVLKQRLKDAADDEVIFPSRQGKDSGKAIAISRRTAYNDIQDIGNMAGIDFCIGCHTLRKTFGYQFYKQYGDIAMLMVWFNHSSVEVTKRYIGIDLDERAKAIKRFVI
jgi:integrase